MDHRRYIVCDASTEQNNHARSSMTVFTCVFGRLVGRSVGKLWICEVVSWLRQLWQRLVYGGQLTYLVKPLNPDQAIKQNRNFYDTYEQKLFSQITH